MHMFIYKPLTSRTRRRLQEQQRWSRLTSYWRPLADHSATGAANQEAAEPWGGEASEFLDDVHVDQ